MNSFFYVKITIIILPSSKDTTKKVKSHKLEEVFATHIADKGLLSRLLLLGRKLISQTTNRKTGERIKEVVYQKKPKFLANIGKSTKLQKSGKCNHNIILSIKIH